jgi:hypothetical protein
MSKENEVIYKGTVAICTPMYGDVAYRVYINSILLLADALRENGYGIAFYSVGNEGLTTRARNTLVFQALQTKDLIGILFLDADQGVDPEDALSLIESGKDVIGAMVPKKIINWTQVKNAVLMREKEEDLALYSGQYSVNFLDEKDIEITYDEPIEVKHVGAGLMYVSVQVFEKLKSICKTYKNGESAEESVEDRTIEFFTTSIAEHTEELLSEDYAFCEKWRSIGGTVWAAPWVQSVHSGTYTFRGSFGHTVDMVSRLNELANPRKED